jgi:threonine aldolase
MTKLPPPPRSAFASDNAAGAHPVVLEAIARANHDHMLAYGDDPVTRLCEDQFGELFGAAVTTRLTFNGTGANVLALGSALAAKPGAVGAIVCTGWSHIHADETGAPERILGAKLIDVDAPDAKVTPDHLLQLRPLLGVQHHVQPGVVSLTQATELGTLYSIDEIGALCETAHGMGMYVHLDGARIANATAALGGTVETLRAFTVDAGVDVVSFGGTKNGLVGAEAVVFLNPEVGIGSEYLRKQVTQLPSKMRFLAAQFNAILADGLWLDLATHANAMATELHRLTATIDGVQLDGPPDVNSIFPTLPREAISTLQEWCFFWDWDVSRDQVRWMTAWDTTVDDIKVFADGVAATLSPIG